MDGPKIAANLSALAQMAGVSGDPRVRAYIRLAALTGDQGLAELLREMIGREVIDRLVSGHPFSVPRHPSEVAGPVTLGTEVYSQFPVGLDLDHGHAVLFGPTGTGKTSAVALMLSRLPHGVTYWAEDPKADLRHRLPMLRGCYPVSLDGDLRLNPLIPYHDVNRKRWMQIVWAVLCQQADLLSGSGSWGLQVLDRVYSEAPSPGPTMSDFAEAVRRELKTCGSRRIQAQYAERVLTRLESLLTVFGDVYDCAVGHPMEDLISSNVIYESTSVETASVQFQLRCLLFAAYQWRLDHRPRTNRTEQVIVIEEAPNVASEAEERRIVTGVPHIDLLFQRSRACGLRFVVCSQTSRLALSIKENAATTISFCAYDGEEREKLGKRMSLSEDQAAATSFLPVGTAIVHVAGRFPGVLVRMDRVPPAGHVTDAQVATHVAPFLARLNASVVPAEGKPAAIESSTKPAELKLVHEDEALVRDVCLFPALSWTERTRLLHERHVLAPTAAQKALKRLENLGLVERVNLKKAGGRGSGFVGLVLTTKGREYLRKHGVRVGKATRGDSRHSLWIDIAVAWHEAQGWTCDTEVELASGVFADVVVRKPDGERIAVEVEFGTETAVRNASKLQSLGLDRIILACDGDALVEAVRRTVESNLPPEARQNVEFLALQGFLGPAEPES